MVYSVLKLSAEHRTDKAFIKAEHQTTLGLGDKLNWNENNVVK